jgi:hypothetical protein
LTRHGIRICSNCGLRIGQAKIGYEVEPGPEAWVALVEVFVGVMQAAVKAAFLRSGTAVNTAPSARPFLIVKWPFAPVAEGQQSFSRTSFDKENQL